MAKGMSEGEKLVVGGVVLGLSAYLLYYLANGQGRENNAALIPDAIEDRIDKVLTTLNARVGKRWGDWGAEKLKAFLRNTLPWQLVALVDVVSTVEQQAKYGLIAKHTKRQHAATMATARGLA